MNGQTYIFAGPQGCGKGTQVELLRKYLGNKEPDIKQVQIIAGERARAFMKEEGYTNSKAKTYVEEGKLLPLFLIVHLWASAFTEEINGGEHIFIDGFPRGVTEAQVFDSAMEFYDRARPNFILIKVSKDESRERLMKRKRSDDNPEIIEKRLNEYEKNTLPVIEFFKNNPKYNYIEINGEQTVEAVHEEIKSALKI